MSLGSVRSSEASAMDDQDDSSSVWMHQNDVTVDQRISTGDEGAMDDTVRVDDLNAVSIASSHNRSLTPTETDNALDRNAQNSRDTTNTADTGFLSSRGTGDTQSESPKSQQNMTSASRESIPNSSRSTTRSAADSGFFPPSSLSHMGQKDSEDKLHGGMNRDTGGLTRAEKPSHSALQHRTSLPGPSLSTHPLPPPQRSSLPKVPRPMSTPVLPAVLSTGSSEEGSTTTSSTGSRGARVKVQRSFSSDGKKGSYPSELSSLGKVHDLHSRSSGGEGVGGSAEPRSKWNPSPRYPWSESDVEHSFYSPSSDSLSRFIEEEPSFEVWVASNDAHRSVLSVLGYNGQFNNLEVRERGREGGRR